MIRGDDYDLLPEWAHDQISAQRDEIGSLRDRLGVIKAALEDVSMTGEDPLLCENRYTYETIKRGHWTEGKYTQVPACEKCGGCLIREALGMPKDSPDKEGV